MSSLIAGVVQLGSPVAARGGGGVRGVEMGRVIGNVPTSAHISGTAAENNIAHM